MGKSAATAVAFAAMQLLIPGGIAAPGTAEAPTAQDAAAGTGSGNARAKTLSEITVEADRGSVHRQVFQYVNRITKSKAGEESLGRWHGPICPRILGLPEDQSDFLVQRLAATAQWVGVTVAKPGCAANLFVLISPEPEWVLQEWTHGNSGPFAAAWPTAIAEFVHGKRAARTWYTDEHIDPTAGQDIHDPSEQGFHTVHRASRVLLNEVLAITSIIVVIDTSLATGYKLGPMADYVAMVGLAQLDVDADLSGAPSILNLFDVRAKEAPGGLTDWDKAFLKGVYSTQQDSRLQREQIVRVMMKDIAP